MSKLDLPKADAIVVGSGPNGLAAAIRLAQAGWPVTVVESAATPGGGVRSAELTLPGFVHDVCSSVYPMGLCSPFLSTLPLKDHGLEWVFPAVPLAHPFDDGTAALLRHSLDETVAGLGADGAAYRRVIGDLLPRCPELLANILGPLKPPRHPFLMAKFGLRAIRAGRGLARSAFKTEKARGFFAGLAAHSMLPLENLSSSAIALVLATAAHAAGWPFARGGSQQFAGALVSYLKSLGGQVVTGCTVESLEQLPPARAVLLDVTPRQLLQIAGERLPSGYRRKLERFRYRMAAYKLDWALSCPVPWRATECRQAGTVHLGGTLDEICESERHAWEPLPPARQGSAAWSSERPFVLFAQPSLFDPSRAPEGKHTAWAYCHVPIGYAGDMTAAIENQVDRFAPGFRDCILARSVMGPAALERHNPNVIGGDIAGGAMNLSQLFLRPTASLYRTPLTGIYLCSSSTPPGPGVHGMCGYWAAKKVLGSV
jgi:phytoene dehydrogenase-like protein